MIKIEQANIKDIDLLCDLLGMLFTQEEEFSPNLQKQREGLKHIISNPEIGLILVLKRNSIVVGMVNILFTISTALGGKVAILEDLIIQPENRGNGDGSFLLNIAIETARKQGCLRITLLTDEINDGAVKFYLRHGFNKSEMTPLRMVF